VTKAMNDTKINKYNLQEMKNKQITIDQSQITISIQYNIGLMNGMSECMPLTKIDGLSLSRI